jgi:hypothetical protein
VVPRSKYKASSSDEQMHVHLMDDDPMSITMVTGSSSLEHLQQSLLKLLFAKYINAGVDNAKRQRPSKAEFIAIIALLCFLIEKTYIDNYRNNYVIKIFQVNILLKK